MTFKALMLQNMRKRGIDESQAEEIMKVYIGTTVRDQRVYQLWYQDVSQHPDIIQNILWMGVQAYADKHLAVNPEPIV